MVFQKVYLEYRTDRKVYAVHSICTMWGSKALYRVLLFTSAKGHLIMGGLHTMDRYSVNSRPIFEPPSCSVDRSHERPLTLLPWVTLG